MICVKDIKEKLNDIIMQDDFLASFSSWCQDNYSDFDIGAKKYVDDLYVGLFKIAEEKVRIMPDSQKKRHVWRSIKQATREHHSAEELFGLLETTPVDLDSHLIESEKNSIEAIQTALDFLFDIRERLHTDYRKSICFCLSYCCIDEFFSAFHLARHNYFLQANTHLRTVLETINLVILFNSKPEFIDVWEKGDFKQRSRELSPASVRSHLGLDRVDPIYSHLSEYGAHPSFSYFQSRTVRKDTDIDRLQIVVWLSGTPLEHLKIQFYLLAFMVIIRFLSLIADKFPEYLDPDEFESRIDYHMAALSNQIIPWALENGLDVNDFKDFTEINLTNTSP